jgi:hypothetical protein
MHRTSGPQRRRGDMTPKLNIDPRALTPVDILHFLRYDAIANLPP